MSHHLLFSAKVSSSMPLNSMCTYSFWISTWSYNKDSYIKHFFTPLCQVTAIDNIHNIVSFYILKLIYYWIPLVSWVPCWIGHIRYNQHGFVWANSQPSPCRSTWVIMSPGSMPSLSCTRGSKQWSMCRAGLLSQWLTWRPWCWYTEFLEGKSFYFNLANIFIIG